MHCSNIRSPKTLPHLLDAEACLDDVINLSALLRSQAIERRFSFYQEWVKHFGAEERLLLMHAIAGMTATKRN